MLTIPFASQKLRIETFKHLDGCIKAAHPLFSKGTQNVRREKYVNVLAAEESTTPPAVHTKIVKLDLFKLRLLLGLTLAPLEFQKKVFP